MWKALRSACQHAVIRYRGWPGLNCECAATQDLLGDHDPDKVGTCTFSGWIRGVVTCSMFFRRCEWIGWMDTYRMTLHRLSSTHTDTPLYGLWTVAAGLQCLFAFSNATRCVASFRVTGHLPPRKTTGEQLNTNPLKCREYGRDVW